MHVQGLRFPDVVHCVADNVVTEGEGFYIPFYCNVRECDMAYVFHRTQRTDFQGRHVFELMAIRPLDAMKGPTLAEIPAHRTVT